MLGRFKMCWTKAERLSKEQLLGEMSYNVGLAKLEPPQLDEDFLFMESKQNIQTIKIKKKSFLILNRTN